VIFITSDEHYIPQDEVWYYPDAPDKQTILKWLQGDLHPDRAFECWVFCDGQGDRWDHYHKDSKQWYFNYEPVCYKCGIRLPEQIINLMRLYRLK
jgi:hypothetical protein